MAFLLKRKPTTNANAAGGSAGAAGGQANGASGTTSEWYDQTPGERFFGFENFGNTCYANSVLQALYFSKPFRELVESYDSPYAKAKVTDRTGQPTSPRSQLAAAGPSASARPQPSSGSPLVSPPSRRAQPLRAASFQSGAPRRQNSATSNDEGGAPLTNSTSFTGVGAPQTNSIAVTDEATGPTTLLSTLHDLFVAISSQPRNFGTVAPQAFINQLKHDNEFFRSTLHQDAHEFLNFLINMIAESVEKKQKEKRMLEPRPDRHDAKTWVHKLFEGILTNETRCLTCETISSRDEAFLDLSIDIEPNSSVTACLRQFSANEMLCQRNKFSCDKCCGLQEAEKRMKIKRLPNILALHLKRFKYEERLQRHVKLTYRVVFPFELRLFNTTDSISNPDRLYKLWAIVVHIGVGPTHGHYITIVKSGARWIVFDDNTVYPIEESDISKFFGDTPGSGSGYVLFYEAADLDLQDFNIDPFRRAKDPPTVEKLANLSAPIVAPSTQETNAPQPSSSANGLGLHLGDPAARPQTAATESSTGETTNTSSDEPSSSSQSALGTKREDGTNTASSGWGLKRGVARIGRSLSLSANGTPQVPQPAGLAAPSTATGQPPSVTASPVLGSGVNNGARRPSSSASGSATPMFGSRAPPSDDGSASTGSAAPALSNSATSNRRGSRTSVELSNAASSTTASGGAQQNGLNSSSGSSSAFAATRNLFSRRPKSSVPPAMSPVHDHHVPLDGQASDADRSARAADSSASNEVPSRDTSASRSTSMTRKEAEKIAKEQRKLREKEEAKRAKEEAKRLKEEAKAEKQRRKQGGRPSGGGLSS